jgi:hypothetical protein
VLTRLLFSPVRREVSFVVELATKLTAHLAHEESDGLPLIDASLTPQEWQNFAQHHTERLRGDAATSMPWLLNGASAGSPSRFGQMRLTHPGRQGMIGS